MSLEDQKFPVTCVCGHTDLRTPLWLQENTHPFCTKCGKDVTVSRDEAMGSVIMSEKKLAEPFKPKD